MYRKVLQNKKLVSFSACAFLILFLIQGVIDIVEEPEYFDEHNKKVINDKK